MGCPVSRLGALLSRLFVHEEINGGERCPTYMHRWELLRIGPWLAVYLHKFIGDDWSLDLHDHPKRFVSIGLRGWYCETRPWGAVATTTRMWSAPWVRTFPAEHVHRITGPTPERPCWTLVIVGRAVREWGFWTAGRWVQWRRYLVSKAATERKSC